MQRSWCGEVKKGRDRTDSDTLGLVRWQYRLQLIDPIALHR